MIPASWQFVEDEIGHPPHELELHRLPLLVYLYNLLFTALFHCIFFMATTTIISARVVSPQNLLVSGLNPPATHHSAMQTDCSTSDPITPRQYQEEIFAHARHSNVIAVLGTGSGKTYISILLIKSITSQAHLSAGKIVVFLVPKARFRSLLLQA